MELMIALIGGVAFSLIFKGAIKAFPLIFYVLALAVAFLFASHLLEPIWPGLVRIAYPYLQKCLFAFVLFAIVMFIGVLPEGSRVRVYFSPIRKELSIIAGFLVIGHVINYFNSYIYQFLSGFVGMSVSVLASFVISLVLVILLAILTITSFDAVRRHMNAKTWKKVQRFAYAFFLLIYLHLLLILLPSAMLAGGNTFVRIVIYSIVFTLYIVFRLMKWKRDRKLKAYS